MQVCETQCSDKIHKISYLKTNDGSFRVACAAGREVLYVEIIENKFENEILTKITDWISSIQLQSTSIMILTAHNLAALLTIHENKLVIEEKVRCEENSTLYCSLIWKPDSQDTNNHWEDILFFCGTALGELVVWQRSEDSAEIIYRQFLHNGVIFSIDYDEEYLVKY